MNGVKQLCSGDGKTFADQTQLLEILHLMQIERERLITCLEAAEYEQVWQSVLQKMHKRGANAAEIANVLGVKKNSTELFTAPPILAAALPQTPAANAAPDTLP